MSEQEQETHSKIELFINHLVKKWMVNYEWLIDDDLKDDSEDEH